TAQHGERVAKTYAIGWLRETGLERKRRDGFRVGPGGARPGKERVEFARRRDRRDAGPKTAQQHHANVVVVDVERHPEIRRVVTDDRWPERGREDADDRVRRIAQRDRS